MNTSRVFLAGQPGVTHGTPAITGQWVRLLRCDLKRPIVISSASRAISTYPAMPLSTGEASWHGSGWREWSG